MRPLIGRGLQPLLPSSRKRMFSRISLFDIAWAGLSPVLAFIVRDGAINQIEDVTIYCCVALIISVIVFQWFKISTPLPHFFSSHDAWTVAKTCVTTVALTAVTLFVFTRLSYAPRSIPIIHFMILACGLIGVRAWNRLNAAQRAPINTAPRRDDVESIMIVGATRLAWFFSMMVEELSSRSRRIVGIVDERPELINRTLNGYSIVGLPKDMAKIIDEYSTHGVEIGKVVVAVDPKELAEATRDEVKAICNAKNVAIEWLYETFLVAKTESVSLDEVKLGGPVVLGPYWKIKRPVDFLVALAALITFMPLVILVAALVLVDVGFPILFWQQRVGYLRQPFHVYKFRTMRSCFDRKGQPISESERLSVFGRLLRWAHVDELPQLINILIGTMSVVGPRPLLPMDQPDDNGGRLQVRPGLTGLAQINGGTLLSAEEKSALDEWYIKHASLLLDIKIILRTVWVVMRGNPRNDQLIERVIAERSKTSECAFEQAILEVASVQPGCRALQQVCAIAPVMSDS